MERTDVQDLTDRLSSRIDDLRDRIAGGLAAESSEARRALDRSTDALAKLGDRTTESLDRIGDELATKIDGLTRESSERFDELQREIHGDHGRGWFSRLFWIATGVGLGTAAAYFLDPDRGRRRRAELSQRATAQVNDLSDTVQNKADYAAGVAKGTAVEGAKRTFGDTPPGDPETLRQKIRSEIVGHVDGAESVVIAVHDQGRVTLKGTVASSETERALLERTRRVPGVATVESNLAVSA